MHRALRRTAHSSMPSTDWANGPQTCYDFGHNLQDNHSSKENSDEEHYKTS